MEVKREKQTDWSGTIGGLAGMNNINENTEIDENSPEYKKWREEEKAIIIPSDARIEKLKKDITNNGKPTKRSKSLNNNSKNKGKNIANNSTIEVQEEIINNKNRESQQKLDDGREICE